MKRLWHFLFGCDRNIDVGHGRFGRVYRCSRCGQAWLVDFSGRKRRITLSEAMDYAEHFEG